jgi:hypothetical protein
MKHASLRPFTAALATFLSLAGFAQAHPGHSAFDWFSHLPHGGHENEYATLLTALGLTCAVFGACWLASRKR